MDTKNLIFYIFVMSTMMLSCCLDSANTKIAYKKPINLKEKLYKKFNKQPKQEIEDIKTTLPPTSQEDDSDVVATTTSLLLNATSSSLCSDSCEKTSFKEDPTTTTTTSRLSSVRNDFSCTCGIFLNSQFVKGSGEQPKGEPVISNSQARSFPCNAIGRKQCQTKCLEQIVQHLPNSANILCASLDRDVRKERAYLFIRNCSSKWYNTNLAAGREYCCKNGIPYNCSNKK